jgi:hypothetical protein
LAPRCLFGSSLCRVCEKGMSLPRPTDWVQLHPIQCLVRLCLKLDRKKPPKHSKPFIVGAKAHKDMWTKKSFNNWSIFKKFMIGHHFEMNLVLMHPIFFDFSNWFRWTANHIINVANKLTLFEGLFQ